MCKRNLVCLIIFTLLLSTSVSPGIAQEIPAALTDNTDGVNLAGGAPWFIQHVDGTMGNSVGAYPSVAFKPGSDYPYISYYNSSDGELWLASPYPNGGSTCGAGGNWWCRMVDTTNDVGKYSSIALWKGSGPFVNWKLGISYYDQTEGDLKYAVYACLGISCEWNRATVNLHVPPNQSVGLYTSLKFTSDGVPHIAYYISNPTGDESLKYASSVSSGGNCGAGASLGLWQCDTVDSGDRVGKYASLDFRWDDSPYIAYYDEGQGNLKYAYYGGIGNCGSGDTWICGVIDGTDGSDVGLYASLKAPQFSSDNYRIAYYDKTHGQLKIAYISAGGNCGNGWQCDVVDDMGTSISPMGISMAVDTSGNPIIAYQQIASDLSPAVLNIARPAITLGLGWGNCGDVPPGYLFLYWQCETLDNASGYTNEAYYVSVALDPDGLAVIAYNESDEYDNFTSLKVAYQTLINLYLPAIIKAP